MDRIHTYNPDTSYKPNWGRYLQIMSAKDLYIQNITVAEHDGHSDSFQVSKRSYELSAWCSESRGSKSSKIGIIINLLFGNHN